MACTGDCFCNCDGTCRQPAAAAHPPCQHFAAPDPYRRGLHDAAALVRSKWQDKTTGKRIHIMGRNAGKTAAMANELAVELLKEAELAILDMANRPQLERKN